MSLYTINANTIYNFSNYKGKNSFKNSAGVYSVNTYCMISVDYYGTFWFAPGRNSSSSQPKYFTTLYVGGSSGYLYYDFGLSDALFGVCGWTNAKTVKSTINNQQFTTNDVFYGAGFHSKYGGNNNTSLQSHHFTQAPTTSSSCYVDNWYFPTMNSNKSSCIYAAFDSSQFWNNNTRGSFVGVDTEFGYAWCCPLHSSQSFKVSLIEKNPYVPTGVGVAKILYDNYGNCLYPSFSIGGSKLYSLFFESWTGEILLPENNNGTAPQVTAIDNGRTFKGITCVNDLLFVSVSDPNKVYDGVSKYYIIVSKILIVKKETGISFTISQTPLYYITKYKDTNGNSYPFDYIGCLTYCSLYDSKNIFAFAQVNISSVINQVILKMDISGIQ